MTTFKKLIFRWKKNIDGEPTPAILSGVFSLTTVSIEIPVQVDSSILSSTFALTTASIETDQQANANILSSAFSVLNPTVETDDVINATILNATVSIGAPTIEIGSTIDASILDTTASILAPTVETTGADVGFVFTVNMTGGGTFSLPLESGYTYDFTVDYGDGSGEKTVTAYNDADASHSYASGTWDITIKGDCPCFDCESNIAAALKITNIKSWGSSISWEYLNFFFCTSLSSYDATDTPNFAVGADIGGLFNQCPLNASMDIDDWDVSNTTKGDRCFRSSGYQGALNSWDVSGWTTAERCFENNTVFNSALSNWRLTACTTTYFMFAGATAFNQNLPDLDVANVVNFDYMFEGATLFNGTITNWVTTSAEQMRGVFKESAFNQPVNHLDMSGVWTCQAMFQDNTAFNQPVNLWDMTLNDYYNNMFYGASAFNQDISDWDWTVTTSITNFMFGATAWSQANYDAFLIALDGRTLQTGVTFVCEATYSTGAATTARSNVATNYTWTFDDGGQN